MRGIARVPSIVRVTLLLLAVGGVAAILFSCAEAATPTPTPPEPDSVDHQHLASGAALADFMRDGTTDPFTASAVRAVQDAIPAAEWSAFVAELGQLRIAGEMSAMMANRSFRRLLEITAPLYDARFGSGGRLQTSAVRSGIEPASKPFDPVDPFEQYVDKATSYLRDWLDNAKEVVDSAMDAAFEPSWQQVFVGGAAVTAVCAGSAGVACPVALGAFLGWTVLGNEPEEDLPEPLREAVTENGEGSGAKLQVTLDNLSPCDAQGCEQNSELDDLKPYFDDIIRIPSQTYEVNRRVDLKLPAATGGDAPLRYSLRPVVPGLESFLGANGGVLVGTPTAVGVYQMTYRVTDDDGDDDDALYFTIMVEEAADQEPTFDETVNPQTYELNVAITPLALPEAIGGDPPLTYGLAPDIPGIQFNAGTRTLSGMPTTAGTHEMTYKVTDADGDAATLSFTVTVTAASEWPEWSDDAVDNEHYFFDIGVAIEPLVLPEATGGAPPLRYSLTPIPGLQFDEQTRTLSGTPTTVDAYWTEYKATDANNNSIFLLLQIFVQDREAALRFAGTVGPQTYEVNSTITPLVLPEATGGVAPIRYSLEPGIPGLRFDQETRTVSGTPTAAGEYPMVYKATDANGDAATLMFVATVTGTTQIKYLHIAGYLVVDKSSLRRPLGSPLSTECKAPAWDAVVKSWEYDDLDDRTIDQALQQAIYFGQSILDRCNAEADRDCLLRNLNVGCIAGSCGRACGVIGILRRHPEPSRIINCMSIANTSRARSLTEIKQIISTVFPYDWEWVYEVCIGG